MMKFGEQLRELRLEKKLGQTELATQLSVNQRTISNWENGIREPDFEMLIKIAAFFKVSCDYLLGVTDM